MNVMRLKTLLISLGVLTVFCAPSWAGSFGAFGSYWDSKDADSSWGGGVRVGFDLTERLELDFRGTYFPDFKNDEFSGQPIDITAIPIDGGLTFNFTPDRFVNPYVGAGITYYSLSVDPGSVDDETGVYIAGGVDVGNMDGPHFFSELMWRKVDTSIGFGAFDRDVRFDGINLNAGVKWRWGK